jgi:hypothetical protein
VTAELLAPALVKRPGVREVAQRYAGVVIIAIVVGSLHISHRPATVCPFRALTGLPCPFCGGTTAASHLGHGDVGGALRASPLAVGLLATWPVLGAIRPPRWWRSPRTRRPVIASALVFSELWQLARFGIVHI